MAKWYLPPLKPIALLCEKWLNEDPQNPSFVEKRKWVLIGLGHWKLNSGALSYGLWNVKKWDSDLIEKEIKDGVELGVVGTCLEFDQGKSEWGQRKRGIAWQSGRKRVGRNGNLGWVGELRGNWCWGFQCSGFSGRRGGLSLRRKKKVEILNPKSTPPLPFKQMWQKF